MTSYLKNSIISTLSSTIKLIELDLRAAKEKIVFFFFFEFIVDEATDRVDSKDTEAENANC